MALLSWRTKLLVIWSTMFTTNFYLQIDQAFLKETEKSTVGRFIIIVVIY